MTGAAVINTAGVNGASVAIFGVGGLINGGRRCAFMAGALSLPSTSTTRN
jgi:hypothetical protein